LQNPLSKDDDHAWKRRAVLCPAEFESASHEANLRGTEAVIVEPSRISPRRNKEHQQFTILRGQVKQAASNELRDLAVGWIAEHAAMPRFLATVEIAMQWAWVEGECELVIERLVNAVRC